MSFQSQGSKQKQYELTSDDEIVDVNGPFKLKLTDIISFKFGKMTPVLQNNKKASKKPNDTFFTIETTDDKTSLNNIRFRRI